MGAGVGGVPVTHTPLEQTFVPSTKEQYIISSINGSSRYSIIIQK